MALRFSTGTRNGLASTSGLKDLFNGGHIKLYTGSQPASADYTESGSLVVTITSSSGTAGLDFGTASAGSLPKGSGVWSGVVAAAGIVGWGRLYGTGGTTGTSSSEVRADFNVGVSGSDLEIANSSLSLSATQTIDTFTLTVPAS
jgi:hypothetical protein